MFRNQEHHVRLGRHIQNGTRLPYVQSNPIGQAFSETSIVHRFAHFDLVSDGGYRVIRPIRKGGELNEYVGVIRNISNFMLAHHVQRRCARMQSLSIAILPSREFSALIQFPDPFHVNSIRNVARPSLG